MATGSTVTVGEPREGSAGGAEVTITGMRKAPGWTFRVNVNVPGEISTRSGGAEVLSVEMTPPAGQELTAASVRSLPVGDVLRLARGAFTNPVLALVAETVGAQFGERPYGGSVEHLRGVAAIYRTALSQGIPPRLAVAEIYDVSAKTASRWLVEARTTASPDSGKPILRSHAEELHEHGWKQKKSREPRRRKKDGS